MIKLDKKEKLLKEADDLQMEIQDWLDYLDRKSVSPEEIKKNKIVWGRLTGKDICNLVSTLFDQLKAILDNMSKSDASCFKNIVARTQTFITQTKG